MAGNTFPGFPHVYNPKAKMFDLSVHCTFSLFTFPLSECVPSRMGDDEARRRSVTPGADGAKSEGEEQEGPQIVSPVKCGEEKV